MVIHFCGSDAGFQHFKSTMLGKASVTGKDVDEAAASVYEVASIAGLYKIPKRFGRPTYFYITTQDKDVLGRIKEYAISGIFFPPIKSETVLAKFKNLEISEYSGPSFTGAEYDSMRVKILAKAENIPPLPDFAAQLVALTRRDSSTINEITKKIKMDQGMSSKVIKLINSPFYGVRQEIASIDRATVLLGFNSVKNIAMALSMDQYFQKPFNMYATTGKAMWHHSYRTACISQEIAKEKNLDQDALYMAGLMHDIGKVVMADFLVKEARFPEDERKQLGFDHAEIGAVILNKWSVSPKICDAVKSHHSFSSNSVLGKIVFYANRIDNDTDESETIIEEICAVMDIPSERLKKKIIPFIQEYNADI